MKARLLLLTLTLLAFCLPSANAQTFTVTNNELVLKSPVTFKAGTAELTEEGMAALGEVKAYMDEKTYISMMRVEGHVEKSGNDQSLSEQRAIAVTKWLTSHGVDCKRLLPVGFGASKPISETSGNTRIAFMNAALKGHAIGSMPIDGGGKVAGDGCN